VAVSSRQEGLDPVGATVGQRGGRVQAVVAELGGEKIDIIPWNEDPAVFVANALSPAQVVRVDIDEENRIAGVTVPERMLSLAIGREGQNARLAAKLTGWRIDIRSDQAPPRPAAAATPEAAAEEVPAAEPAAADVVEQPGTDAETAAKPKRATKAKTAAGDDAPPAPKKAAAKKTAVKKEPAEKAAPKAKSAAKPKAEPKPKAAAKTTAAKKPASKKAAE
jgi:hypothetical protein